MTLPMTVLASNYSDGGVISSDGSFEDPALDTPIMNAENEDVKMPEIRKRLRYKVYSWNTWCIPYCTPRMLSNPRVCSKYARKVAENHNWRKFNGLILFHFQELWAFRTGLIPPFVVNLISLFECIPLLGFLLSWILQTVIALMGLVPVIGCLPMWHDPKRTAINYLQQWLPHSVSHSCQVPYCPFWKWFDHGLLILCNERPDLSGFQPFHTQTCTDSFAQKGFIYAWFERRQLLVINTHLQAAGGDKTRVDQLQQMREFLQRWTQEHGELQRLICAGDFNIDQRSNALRMVRYEAMKELGFQHSRAYEGSLSDSKMADLRPTEVECDEDHNELLVSNTGSIELEVPMAKPSRSAVELQVGVSLALANVKKMKERKAMGGDKDSAESKKMKMKKTTSTGSSKNGGHIVDINLHSFETYANLHFLHPRRSLIFGADDEDAMAAATEGCGEKMKDGKKISSGLLLGDEMQYASMARTSSPPSVTPSPRSTTRLNPEHKSSGLPIVPMIAASGSGTEPMTGGRPLRKAGDSQLGLTTFEAMGGINEDYYTATTKYDAGHPIQKQFGVGVLRKNFIPICEVLNVKKLNTFEPTMKMTDWNIDHVLVLNSMRVRGIKNGVYARRGSLSDHFLIMTEFEEVT